MKKLIILTLSLLLLTSCGTSPAGDTTDVGNETSGQQSEVASSQPETTTAADTTTADTTSAAKTAVTYDCRLDNGVTVTIGAKAGDVLEALTAKLGKELDYMEAPSCVHPGSDKVYTFDGFSVTSSPDADGNEYIAELTFLSDSAAFENGVMIGSSEADVTAAFGKDFEEKFGVRKYSIDGVLLTITFTDGAVTAMSVSVAL